MLRFQLFVSCQPTLRQIRAEENQPERSPISFPTITTVCCPEKQPVFLLCGVVVHFDESATLYVCRPNQTDSSSPVPFSQHKSILYVSIDALLINGRYLASCPQKYDDDVISDVTCSPLYTHFTVIFRPLQVKQAPQTILYCSLNNAFLNGPARPVNMSVHCCLSV